MTIQELPAGEVDRVSIVADLAGLENSMGRIETVRRPEILAVDPAHRSDAVNLVHYLALRQGDVRHLQRWLGARGLSSLGRCEAHVMATVESLRAAIDGTAPRFGPAIQSFEAGRSALDNNTDALLNKGPYVDEAIVFLDDILRRTSRHQRKNTPLLRPLRSWTPPAAQEV